MNTQDSQSNISEAIENILRFNCPIGCNANGSYPEQTADDKWEQGQCQWCFEYGMPAREAIEAYVTARVKEAERLARIDELVHISAFSSYYPNIPFGHHITVGERLESLTTKTNGKED